MDISWFKNIIERVKIIFSFKKVNSPTIKIENKADNVKTQIGQQIIINKEIQTDQKLTALYRYKYFKNSQYGSEREIEI